MTLEDTSSPPRRRAPAAWLATMQRHEFKPGMPGVITCEAVTRRGTVCCQPAVKGLFYKGERRCYVHGANTLRALRRKGRKRCEALNVKRPRHQCEHPATAGTLCRFHATQEARGKTVERVPPAQRVERMPFKGAGDTSKRAAERQARKRRTPSAREIVAARFTASLELTRAPVWQIATEPERAALVHAWESREASPEAWRALVRQIVTRSEAER